MKLLSNEHNPNILEKLSVEDKQEIDGLVKHREWLKERLEVHSHNIKTREILSEHLNDIRWFIKQKINDYKENYGKAHQLLS